MKKYQVIIVAMLCLSTVEVKASPIYASNFDRMIYANDHCYLETYSGQTTLGNPDIINNLLGESDSAELGWRKPTPIDGFVVSFSKSLMDGNGDDLIIRDFGPGTYTVFVSAADDDPQYVEIGESTVGTPCVFNEYGFDFAGLNNVNYIKITRTSNAPHNGRFFDSFEGTHPIPEPCTLALLSLGSLCFMKRKKRC